MHLCASVQTQLLLMTKTLKRFAPLYKSLPMFTLSLMILTNFIVDNTVIFMVVEICIYLESIPYKKISLCYDQGETRKITFETVKQLNEGETDST